MLSPPGPNRALYVTVSNAALTGAEAPRYSAASAETNGPPMNEYRIIIADDHALIREGITALLAATPQITVAGHAADGLEALARTAELAPDVVLMDLFMPHMDGIEATREIKARHPGVRVLMLSVDGREAHIRDALAAGADGYVLKSIDGATLREALGAVNAGERYLGAEIAPPQGAVTTPRESALSVLSPREREVLKLIAEGMTNRAAAEVLGLSPKTVETHRSRLMRKLDVHKTAELVGLALRGGLLD